MISGRWKPGKGRLMNVHALLKSTLPTKWLSMLFPAHGMCDHEWLENPMLSPNEAGSLQVLRTWVRISWRRTFLQTSPHQQWTRRARLAQKISEFRRTWGEKSIRGHWSKGYRHLKPNTSAKHNSAFDPWVWISTQKICHFNGLSKRKYFCFLLSRMGLVGFSLVTKPIATCSHYLTRKENTERRAEVASSLLTSALWWRYHVKWETVRERILIKVR